MWKFINELNSISKFSCSSDFFICCPILTIGNIFFNATSKKDWFLADKAYFLSDPFQLKFSKVDAVNENFTGFRIIKSFNQTNNC
ncbi:hypothetical protein VIGAN_01504900 [Vigna angularis var. angularis]|uniref:Uncharacterized protein n=1 Tax=Vigna angularis var. angularis TaxID=157739 RepID=A0A0S3R924_PHAAN|nr:hypothetical protein VIGAN_01504900 [Vigna angularis var. angularis]